MPYKIKKESNERMLKIEKSEDLRVSLIGPHGTLIDFIREDFWKDKTFTKGVQTDILGYCYMIFYKKLKYKEKIEIKIFDELQSLKDPHALKRFLPEVEDEIIKPDGESNIGDITYISHRFKFLFGLAFVSVCPRAKMTVYDTTQKKENKLFSIHRNGISIFMIDWIDMTDNKQENLRRAFNYLWFNYPVDITGFDDRIKRITLEEMIK